MTIQEDHKLKEGFLKEILLFHFQLCKRYCSLLVVNFLINSFFRLAMLISTSSSIWLPSKSKFAIVFTDYVRPTELLPHYDTYSPRTTKMKFATLKIKNITIFRNLNYVDYCQRLVWWTANVKYTIKFHRKSCWVKAWVYYLC